VQAVLAELTSRVVVAGRRVLYWPAPVAADGAAAAPQLLIQLTPARQQDFLAEQADRTVRAAVEREDRLPEILSQRAGFVDFFGALTGIDLAAAPALRELLATWSAWADLYVMALKNDIAEPRPFQRSALVSPVIATPPHGSLPSGHATAAAMMSEILSALLYAAGHPRTQQLDRLARRIAFNRVVAGVHFQMDSAAGYALGRQLAGLFVALACGGNAPTALRHNVAQAPDLPELARHQPVARGGPGVTVAPLLARLWGRAEAELETLRV
jgi:hypothetical protein